jgi:hypothetical protein
MRSRVKLASAVAALSLSAMATTALAQSQDTFYQFGRAIGGSYAGGEFYSDNDAFWSHNASNADQVNSSADSGLRVQLFNQNWWVYSGLARGMTARWNNEATLVGSSGSVVVMNNTIISVNIPNTWARDSGFDQTKTSGSITFFNASGTVPVGPFPVTLSLKLTGQVDFEVTSLEHASAMPWASGESDYTLSIFQIKPSTKARGSVTVASFGVYGEVTPLAGSFGPASAVTRTFVPSSMTVNFKSDTNCTASLNAFGGSVGLTGLGYDVAVVNWGAPWSWSTRLYPSQSNVNTQPGSF